VNRYARGFFVASSGTVTDEVIMEYIRTQETKTNDDDFRVSEE
jgi:REP element-mobilizing transposase RayT